MAPWDVGENDREEARGIVREEAGEAGAGVSTTHPSLSSGTDPSRAAG